MILESLNDLLLVIGVLFALLVFFVSTLLLIASSANYRMKVSRIINPWKNYGVLATMGAAGLISEYVVSFAKEEAPLGKDRTFQIPREGKKIELIYRRNNAPYILFSDSDATNPIQLTADENKSAVNPTTLSALIAKIKAVAEAKASRTINDLKLMLFLSVALNVVSILVGLFLYFQISGVQGGIQQAITAAQECAKIIKG